VKRDLLDNIQFDGEITHISQSSHGPTEENQSRDNEEDMTPEEGNDSDDSDLLGLGENEEWCEKERQDTEEEDMGVSDLDLVEQNFSDQLGQSADNDEDMYYTCPQERFDLENKLKGGYTLSISPPGSLKPPEPLTESETLSLKHYIAWRKSNGTVLAYELHADVLQKATGLQILPLYSVRELAKRCGRLCPQKIDICPNTCMAYTGDYANLTHCCHVKKDNTICGEPRYGVRGKAKAQMVYISCLDVITAMFANVETATMLRQRDTTLKHVLYLLNKGANVIPTYSDFADSAVHRHHYQSLGLFQGERDIALALSTDSAQLTMKKQSNTLVALLELLNLPGELRYQTNNTMVPFIIPGPNNPGNVDSFMHPLFVDMAKASEGIWMWDAVDSSYFVNHAYLCMVLGDMLGSAKMSGMAGHTAVHGDRFSMIKGARASLKKGSKYQYYPIAPPKNAIYNPTRQPCYDLDNLPVRAEKHYWDTIKELLDKTKSKRQCEAITRESGISRMPLAAASPAFIHPSFFPLDPFHLFFENIMPFLWDTWRGSSQNDKVHVTDTKAKMFGELVAGSMKTLPASFCGRVRDVHLKRQSQYKAYEWMALLYWYILSAGIEVGFPDTILQNFAYLHKIVKFSMTIKPRSEDEINELQKLIKKFLLDYESIYVGDDPEKISRCRLCILQLIHIPNHIRWYGSIRLGSQATVERTIGEAGHKIHSKKSPFANMANIFFEKELVKVLLLYYPELETGQQHDHEKPKLFGHIRILKRERHPGEQFYNQLTSVFENQPQLGEFDPTFEIKRFGKCNLPNAKVLGSMKSEAISNRANQRSRCYFELHNKDGNQPKFGRALAFFELAFEERKQNLVVYNPLEIVCSKFDIWRGKWSENVNVTDIMNISDMIGVFEHNSRVYPLQKYPAFDWMANEEKGIEKEDCLQD
jgi:hypothetical protein